MVRKDDIQVALQRGFKSDIQVCDNPACLQMGSKWLGRVRLSEYVAIMTI